MPGIIPPGPGIGQAQKGKAFAPTPLSRADGANGRADASIVGRVADALSGWHSLNMAVAKTLPTHLLAAAQWERAARRTLATPRRRR